MSDSASEAEQSTQLTPSAGPLQLCVLGPVAADVAGEPIALGGPKQKAVLAVLIAAGGATVGADVLAQAVYGEDAPDRARRRIQTYVSTLRSILGEVIVRRGGGWALDLDRDDVDATRFEDLIDEAQRAEPVTASALLSDALGLWRGDPYDGVETHGHLDAEVTRLGELRLQALEARIDADLDAGKDAALVPELAALLQQHPYREGLRARHMVALYRAGRQQEALQSFIELRQLLLDELGVDPTPEIRRLEQQILEHDESLLLTPAGEGRPLRGYRLVEQIGAGAFSLVWRGVQPSVDREVAIKQIRAELASRPEFIRRFEAEAQLVAHIEHPHVVPLIDYWRDPDSAYLVMRWLRGGTVEESLDAGRWDVEQTVRMAGQVGEALAEAHARGVIHRDVKTANILLDERGNAYLGDFGIALDAIESAGPEAALSQGSPAYAAPEQIRKESLGPQADIFSLGVVVYECLTGELPFPEVRTATEMLRRQLEDPYPDLRTVRPDVPEHIAEAIGRATAKRAEDRFESALDFVAALDAEPVAAAVSSGGGVRRTTFAGDIANPYKGLRAFDESDAARFFGRDRLVDELVSQLESDDVASRFLTVVGPSGSGKSSVVRAGLLPAIRAGRVSGSDQWFVTTMVPGSHPFEALEAALLRIAVNPPATLVHQLRDGARGILRGARRCLAGDRDRVLLVVDQFEELFTAATADMADQFLQALTVAAQDPTSPLRVVATLRADYYDRPLAHPAFASVLKAGAIDVTPLAPDELEAAITAPAERAGLELEAGLVARLAAESVGQAAPLPLLQYTLAELFDRREGNVLTNDAFAEVGGLIGSLAARAEELYASASSTEQHATRRIFGRLVSPGEMSSDLRRRVLVGDLGDDEATRSVLDRYGTARLLTFDRDVTSREPTVEVAHEALLREWPRLVQWLDQDRELLQSVERLSAAATVWAEGGRQPTDLYRGGRLEQSRDLLVDAPDRLRPVDRDFVGASQEAAGEERHLEQQRLIRLRRLVAGVGVALVLALVAGGIAFQQQRRADDEADQAAANAAQAEAAAAEADEQREAAEENAAAAAASAEEADFERTAAERAALDAEDARGLAEARALTASASDVLDEDGELALLLALQGAAGQADDPTALRVLRRALQLPATLYTGNLDPSSFFREAAMSSDGRRFVGGGETHIEMRDVDTGETLWRYEYGLAPALGTAYMTFVNDDEEVAVAVRWEPIGPPSRDFPEALGLHILDAETGELQRRIAGGLCGGAIFANTLGEGRIHYRAVTDEFVETVDGCGLDPASGTVVAQDFIVDVNTGSFAPVGEPVRDGPGAAGFFVAFDAEGRRMATDDRVSGLVRVVDLETDDELFRLEDPPPAAVMQLSSDGRLLIFGGASNGDERRLYLFDVDSGELISSLEGHTSETVAAAFIAGDTRVATTGPDGRINVWDTSSGELDRSISSGVAGQFLWASEDGRRVGVKGSAVAVVSLDVADSAELGVIRICPDDGAFYAAQGLRARNGRLSVFAGCGTDYAVPYVVDLATGALIGQGTSARTQGQDLSEDGTVVVAQRYEPPAPGAGPGRVGPLVVTDLESGTDVVLPGLCDWGLERDEPGCRPPPEFPYALNAWDIDISADARLVAASSGTAGAPGIVWDLPSGEVVGQWSFLRAAFLDDGARIATFGFDSGSGVDESTLAVRETEAFEVIDELIAAGPFPQYTVASPDSSRLISMVDSDIVIHSVEPLEEVARWFNAHDGGIQSVSVSDDGTKVATVATDGVARVWELETGTLLHDIQVSETDRAQAAVFRNNDAELLVSTSTGPIRIYTLDTEELLSIARSRVPRGFTAAECDRYFADVECPTLDELRAG